MAKKTWEVSLKVLLDLFLKDNHDDNHDYDHDLKFDDNNDNNGQDNLGSFSQGVA